LPALLIEGCKAVILCFEQPHAQSLVERLLLVGLLLQIAEAGEVQKRSGSFTKGEPRVLVLLVQLVIVIRHPLQVGERRGDRGDGGAVELVGVRLQLARLLCLAVVNELHEFLKGSRLDELRLGRPL